MHKTCENFNGEKKSLLLDELNNIIFYNIIFYDKNSSTAG
jgi:hypothetical protein